MTRTGTSVAIAMVVATIGCGRAAQWPSPMDADLASRSTEIHWPRGFAPSDADTFAHNAALVRAPCARVWSALVEARRWPDWYENARDVRLADGGDALRAGSRFEWTTFGFAVESTVHELEPTTRLGWFGRTNGLDAYHTWLLRDVPAGCDVVTEEVGRGPAARELRSKAPGAIHDGHTLWLQRLAAISEGKERT